MQLKPKNKFLRIWTTSKFIFTKLNNQNKRGYEKLPKPVCTRSFIKYQLDKSILSKSLHMSKMQLWYGGLRLPKLARQTIVITTFNKFSTDNRIAYEKRSSNHWNWVTNRITNIIAKRSRTTNCNEMLWKRSRNRKNIRNQITKSRDSQTENCNWWRIRTRLMNRRWNWTKN